MDDGGGLLGASRGPVRVLVVEPHPEEAARIRGLLAGNGARYVTESVTQPEDGLARLRDGAVDVTLVRVRPAEDFGIETALKFCCRSPEVPVIALTDPADEALAMRAVQHGVFDYLNTDSLDAEKLVRAIAYVMEQRRLLTALEQSSGRLQASQANLQHIIESNADGVLVIDRHGVVRFLNRAVEMLLQRPAGELLGQPFSVSVAPGQSQDLPIPGKDGETRVAELRVVETMWEEETANLVSLRDVTDRRRLERMKDEFVAMVSHELRTPLTSVKGAVTLMLNQSLGSINEEQRDFLQTISSDIDRLTELINNLLDLSKIEAGKMVLTRRLVDLGDLAEQACRSYQALLGERKVVHNRFGNTKVYGDAYRILQVLGNLLGNAIKFTKPDGTITIGLVSRGSVIEVMVDDDGPGISEKDLGRLFQKFEQLQGPSKDRPRGTGLGLAISKEIVELHGGKISVSSVEGNGSSFIFTLPVFDPATAFAQIFQETKAAAAQQQDIFGVLLLDASELRGRLNGSSAGSPEDVLQAWALVVQKNIAAHDRLVMLEPNLLAILAVTDRPGLQAMTQRLEKVCGEWGKQVLGPERPAQMRMASALYPEDGAFALPILRELRVALDARKGATPSAPKDSAEVPHG